MIYDLEELDADNNSVTDDPASLERDKLRNRINLAIAERLEALAEAQKPRLVHLEAFDDGEGFLVNPTYVVDVSWRKWKDGGCVGVVTDSCDHDSDEHFRVKGTLAEVMAKLRGEA